MKQSRARTVGTPKGLVIQGAKFAYDAQNAVQRPLISVCHRGHLLCITAGQRGPRVEPSGTPLISSHLLCVSAGQRGPRVEPRCVRGAAPVQLRHHLATQLRDRGSDAPPDLREALGPGKGGRTTTSAAAAAAIRGAMCEEPLGSITRRERPTLPSPILGGGGGPGIRPVGVFIHGGELLGAAPYGKLRRRSCGEIPGLRKMIARAPGAAHALEVGHEQFEKCA